MSQVLFHARACMHGDVIFLLYRKLCASRRSSAHESMNDNTCVCVTSATRVPKHAVLVRQLLGPLDKTVALE